MSHHLSKPILAIESSCDEMAAAVMTEGRLVSEVVASQAIHTEYGGVVPEFAARAHQVQIIPVVNQALQKAKIQPKDLGSIAVTQGPGLLGSLLVGNSFAKGMSLGLNIPLLGIHHLQAHLLANFLEKPHPTFPFLGLIISGGHTQLIRAERAYQLYLLGSTEDDAVGEAFDKIAKTMGIPYPGGKQLDDYALQGHAERFSFPVTVMPGYQFSFSGIKTAFRYLIEKESKENSNFVTDHLYDLCASVQATLVKMIIIKVEKALIDTKLSTLVIGGGVGNNRAIRVALRKLAKQYNIKLFFPAHHHTTDNAAMIAMTAHFAWQQGHTAFDFGPMPRMELPLITSK
ncbi:MAG: tRNA (adenosine(37)-N6)-threonylcarbamoyltransferase complex transferase subunit TsaD [Bacteroidota bacterium]